MTKPIIVVMGVSGSGKSTIAEGVANKLNVDFVDGDDLHPKENVAKMASGTPLNDEDRKPWLQQINKLMVEYKNQGKGIVVVCSALKQDYRDQLRGFESTRIEGLTFIYLSGSYELISSRMKARQGHFMKAGMLKGQFDTLEEPNSTEKDVVTVNINQSMEGIIAQTYCVLC